MAARTVVCPECSETLPYGRLSCPACGSLLAAVAGGPVRQVASSPAPVELAAETPALTPAEPAPPRSRRRWRGKQDGALTPEESQEPVVAAAAPAVSAVPPTTRPARSAAPRHRSAGLAPSKVGAVTLAARLDGSTPVAAAVGAVPPVLGDWPAAAAPATGDAFSGPSPWLRDGVQRPQEIGWDDDVVRRRGSNGNGADGAPAILPPWAGGPGGATMTAQRPVARAYVSSDADSMPPAYLPP